VETAPALAGAGNPSVDLPLVEPMGGIGEEMLAVTWRSNHGEPCCGGTGGEGPQLPVWPLEAVVRGARVLYAPELFLRLRGVLEPLLTPAVQWDAQGQVRSGKAREAKRAMAIVLQNVALQQQVAAEGDETLPYRVRVKSAVLENVSPDLRELATAFGLARMEEASLGGVGCAGNAAAPQVEDMDMEQLRAEVQMWRMRQER